MFSGWGGGRGGERRYENGNTTLNCQLTAGKMYNTHC